MEYAENQLVEQPAIAMFAELGWSAVSAVSLRRPRDLRWDFKNYCLPVPG